MDSDFSIDENDEVKSDLEDEDEGKKRKKGIHTKAYKVRVLALFTGLCCFTHCLTTVPFTALELNNVEFEYKALDVSAIRGPKGVSSALMSHSGGLNFLRYRIYFFSPQEPAIKKPKKDQSKDAKDKKHSKPKPKSPKPSIQIYMSGRPFVFQCPT